MTLKKSTPKDTGALSEKQWPAEELEIVQSCPVCGASDCKLFMENAHDNIFGCAPGKWNVYLCSSCGTGYLNPRPNHKSIGKAYDAYYTHSAGSADSVSQRFQKALANGYKNYRYGTSEKPASLLGVAVAYFFPGLRAIADGRMRHLPESPYEGARLLDVGCGGGEFLAQIQSTRWTIMGVDQDPAGVELARSRGFTVHHGTIESMPLERYSQQFEAMTLSHVLEHVHDPMSLLLTCRKLLAPGGWIWVETPNLDSQGFEKYGKSWLGLDAPRHLTHFTRESLKTILEKAGFTRIEDLPYRPLCANVFAISEQISKGNGYMMSSSMRERLSNWNRSRPAEAIAKRHPEKREFSTFRAYAPDE